MVAEASWRQDLVKGELELTPRTGRRAFAAGDSPRGKWSFRFGLIADSAGDEQFAIEPGSTALVIVFGNMSDLRDGLGAFEGQLHLPAEPVSFEDLIDTRLGVGQGGEDEDILGVSAGDCANCLTGLFLQGEPSLRSHDSVRALANRADAAFDPRRRRN